MSKKIVLVTGGSGLVGQAIQRVIKEEHPSNEEWIFISSKDANLMDPESTRNIFDKYKPTHVVHLAAVVGGLFANLGKNHEMMRQNLWINDNVLEAAKQHNCQKVVSCLSTCIFPDKITYPFDETMLHNGPPHKSNAGFAHAKRMLDVSNHLYYRQYNLQYTSIIPTNIYGPYDNFSLKDSHMIPGLIHKCFLAKKEKGAFIINGTGIASRQFVFSDDLARIAVWSLREYKEIDPIIITVPEKDETTVKDIAEMIAKAMDFKGEIKYDRSKSDGQLKKTASDKKLRSYLPDYEFKPLKEGIQETVDWFKSNYPNIRLGQ